MFNKCFGGADLNLTEADPRPDRHQMPGNGMVIAPNSERMTGKDNLGSGETLRNLISSVLAEDSMR